MTPSDLSWEWARTRGCGTVRDYHDFGCTVPLSSWVVVEDMLFIDRKRDHPFFVMAWSQQSAHHPYEPTPGVPLLELVHEPTADSDGTQRAA